ncbi:MAG: nucleotidyltransferase family protein [Cyanophyceae cyanobacterium]
MVYTLSTPLLILLTCARLELNEDQSKRLVALCQEIEDPTELISLAQTHMVLSLMYRHLRGLELENISPALMESLRASCFGIVGQTLRLGAEQQQLVSEVLQPLDVPYVLFKGPSLAVRYYGDLGLRQARDIDVLIKGTRLFEVVEALLERGYRLYPGMLAELYDEPFANRQDLEAACRYLNVMSLVSPNGILLELHRFVDTMGHIFPPQMLLAMAEPLEFRGVSYQVLSTAALFVYICYHHSRHQWSRLHWLADLDAVQRDPSFDLSEVRQLAARLGLTSLVNAALELHRACAEADPGAVALTDPLAQSMRDECLQNIASKENLRASHRPPASTSWAAKMRYLAATYLRPTYTDYKSWPLPSTLHPVYYVSRPFRGLLKRTSHSAEEILS